MGLDSYIIFRFWIVGCQTKVTPEGDLTPRLCPRCNNGESLACHGWSQPYMDQSPARNPGNTLNYALSSCKSQCRAAMSGRARSANGRFPFSLGKCLPTLKFNFSWLFSVGNLLRNLVSLNHLLRHITAPIQCRIEDYGSASYQQCCNYNRSILCIQNTSYGGIWR